MDIRMIFTYVFSFMIVVIFQCHSYDLKVPTNHEFILNGLETQIENDQEAFEELKNVLYYVNNGSHVELSEFSIPKKSARWFDPKLAPNSSSCPRELVDNIIKRFQQQWDLEKNDQTRLFKVNIGPEFAVMGPIQIRYLGPCKPLVREGYQSLKRTLSDSVPIPDNYIYQEEANSATANRSSETDSLITTTATSKSSSIITATTPLVPMTIPTTTTTPAIPTIDAFITMEPTTTQLPITTETITEESIMDTTTTMTISESTLASLFETTTTDTLEPMSDTSTDFSQDLFGNASLEFSTTAPSSSVEPFTTTKLELVTTDEAPIEISSSEASPKRQWFQLGGLFGKSPMSANSSESPSLKTLFESSDMASATKEEPSTIMEPTVQQIAKDTTTTTEPTQTIEPIATEATGIIAGTAIVDEPVPTVTTDNAISESADSEPANTATPPIEAIGETSTGVVDNPMELGSSKPNVTPLAMTVSAALTIALGAIIALQVWRRKRGNYHVSVNV